MTTSGAFASTFTMTGITGVTFPTSGTLATTSQIPTGAALTKTDDTNVTLTLGGSPTTALVNAASLTLGWTGTLDVTRGGTSRGSATAYGIICGGTTSTGAFQSVSVGSSTQLLRSNGGGSLPGWTTTTYPSTAAQGDVMISTVINGWSGLAKNTSATRYLSNTGASNTPAWAQIELTNGVTGVLPAANGGRIVTASIAGTTQAAAISTNYIVANAAQTTITLPTTFAIGDVVIIKGLGAGGWILAAGTATTIRLGSSVTSSAGSLTSVNQYDTVAVSGLVANTTWSVDYVLSAGLTVA